MFPSSGESSNNNNPFPYNYGSSFENDENPNSRQDQDSSFLHFPSPWNDELLANLLYSQHQHQHQQQQLIVAAAMSSGGVSAPPQAEAEAEVNMAVEQTPSSPSSEVVVPKKKKNNCSSVAVSAAASKKQAPPRKRTGKKDRHSKIYTAQGPRDRRMRLSLQIARKFFDLQDMLGFDKASKTIDWLFTKSKKAIKELMGNLPHQVKQHHSTCNDHGGKIDEMSNNGKDNKEVIANNDDVDSLAGLISNVKNERKPRNMAAFHPLIKECRDKARARARERTREKMMIRSSLIEKSSCYETNPNYLEVGEDSGSPSQDINSSFEGTAAEVELEEEEPAGTYLLEHQMATVGIIDDKFLGMASQSTSPLPSSNFNYLYSNVVATSNGIFSNNNILDLQGHWRNITIEDARIQSAYCAMTTDFDPSSTGDVVHEQNPSSSFVITSNLGLQSQFLGN